MVDALLAVIAHRQLGLITYEQARQHLDDEAIRHRLAAGRWERVHRGVYRIAGYPITYEQRVLAAVLAAGPDAVASHRSAAVLWGFDDVAPDVVEISVRRPRCHRLRGVVLHRSTDLLPADVSLRSRIPVTNPMRTLVDLGAVAPLALVSVALQQAVTRRLVSYRAVQATLDRVARKGRRGVGPMRLLLAERVAAPRPAGVFEGRMASLLRRAGIEAREEYNIYDDDGRWLARVDFALPDARVFIELDGLETHGSGPALQRDLTRQNALVAAGWEPLRFIWFDVTRRSDNVISTTMKLYRKRLRFLARLPGPDPA
jgi:hypothetical protein